MFIQTNLKVPDVKNLKNYNLAIKLAEKVSFHLNISFAIIIIIINPANLFLVKK